MCSRNEDAVKSEKKRTIRGETGAKTAAKHLSTEKSDS